MEAVRPVGERRRLAAADGEVALRGVVLELPADPGVPLNGEHAGTAGGAIVGDGEFGVAVPLIVPMFVIVVPAVDVAGDEAALVDGDGPERRADAAVDASRRERDGAVAEEARRAAGVRRAVRPGSRVEAVDERPCLRTSRCRARSRPAA